MAVFSLYGVPVEIVGETQPKKVRRNGKTIRHTYVVCKRPDGALKSYEWDELKADGGAKEIRDTLDAIQTTKD